jgi:hypothetical protein
MEQGQKQEIHETADVTLSTTEDELTKTLADVKAHVNELEDILINKDSEISTLTQLKDNLEKQIEGLNRSLMDAVSGYRAMVIQSNHEIPEEMLSGDTIEAIGESLKRAKTLVGKVRKSLETDLLTSQFPAGAPERSVPVLDMSPREKILHGIENQK